MSGGLPRPAERQQRQLRGCSWGSHRWGGSAASPPLCPRRSAEPTSSRPTAAPRGSGRFQRSLTAAPGLLLPRVWLRGALPGEPAGACPGCASCSRAPRSCFVRRRPLPLCLTPPSCEPGVRAALGAARASHPGSGQPQKVLARQGTGAGRGFLEPYGTGTPPRGKPQRAAAIPGLLTGPRRWRQEGTERPSAPQPARWGLSSELGEIADLADGGSC